jgi:hypothetical protein
VTNIVYVVMRQPEDDWGAGPRAPDAIFTSKERADQYAIAANETDKSRKHRMFYYWVDEADDIELDPKPWGEIE